MLRVADVQLAALFHAQMRDDAVLDDHSVPTAPNAQPLLVQVQLRVHRAREEAAPVREKQHTPARRRLH
eukprot:30886-Pelagococcus_subviridis.AAC.2